MQQINNHRNKQMKSKILKKYGIEKIENALNVFETQLKDDELAKIRNRKIE